MSKNNNLDQNRIDRMIQAALENSPTLMPKLQELADRMEEPCDALAGFLVGDLHFWGNYNFSDYETDEDWKTLPCTGAQWNFFMERCREATKKAKVTDAETMSRYARIGEWPNRIPLGYELKDTKFLEMGWETVWAWVWYKDAKTASFLLGQQPYCEIARHENGWVIARGLCDAIEHGLITAPADPIPFVIAYAGWYSGPGNADVGHLCYHSLHLNARIGEMPESTLQTLATCWEWAARELGKRNVSLMLPLVQLKRDWGFGVRDSIMSQGFDADVEAYVTTTNVALRYVLWSYHTHSDRAVLIDNLEDPFGPKINLFCQKTGQYSTPEYPTYEDALEFVLNKK